MQKIRVKMKIHNTLVRQCLGEIIGTFVLLLTYNQTDPSDMDTQTMRLLHFLCDSSITLMSCMARSYPKPHLSFVQYSVCYELCYEAMNNHTRRGVSVFRELFGCSAAAQVKTGNELKGQYLSANLSFSVGVMSAMYLCMGVSGAHLNPAVSLSFCVLGDLPWQSLLPYSLSQVLGAYLASAVVYTMYYDAIINYSGGVLTVYGPNETASIFATYPTPGTTLQTNIFDQVVGTATLLLCILPLSDKNNRPAPVALLPPIVAAVVLGIGMAMSSNCGGAINPARDLGPRLFTLTAGWGTEVFTCYNYFFWVPMVAPLFGALLGCFVYQLFIQWHLPDPDPETVKTQSQDTEIHLKVVAL